MMTTPSIHEIRADEARGNFKAGNYNEALVIFKELASGHGKLDESFRAKMLGNAAQCCLKLGSTKEVTLLSLQCLQIDPFNPKVHYRMSVAYSSSNLRLAFKHICICVGLLGSHPHSTHNPRKLDPTSKKQFELLKSRVSVELPDEINVLPDDASKVVVVSSMDELNLALRNRMQIIVLKPGTYPLTQTISTSSNPFAMMMMGGSLCQMSKLWLLGLTAGAILVKPPNPNMGHVVSSQSDASIVVVENISILDTTMQRNGASFVVAGRENQMAVKNCTISKSGDNPVLCADGAIVHVLDSCFESMPMASGVEIRERGRGKIVGCSMKNLRQGVIGYAGAEDVVIRDCIIENTVAEAFLFDGSKKNAATRAQKEGLQSNTILNANAHEVSRQVSRLALEEKWSGLKVLLEGCTVRNIGNFGASCDHGASVRIKGCIFDSCQMHGLFIKGETDVDVSDSAFLNHREAAVAQAVNYGGIVNVKNIVCFKNKVDFKDEMNEASRQHRQFARAANMFSTPMIKNNIMHVSSRQEVPSVQDLLQSAQSRQETLKTQTTYDIISPPSSTSSFAPCRGGFKQSQPSYYAIGNTAGQNILRDKDCMAHATAVLFAACGDIRNVVETITDWWRRHKDDRNELSVTLNDQSASMLVRDLVLLELFRSASPRCVAEAWACLGVKPQVKEKIAEVMKSLEEVLVNAKADRDTASSFPFFVVGEEDRVLMQLVLTSWLNNTLELKDIRRDLDMMTLVKAETLSQAAVSGTKPNLGAARQIKNYTRTLSVGSKATALNITMLEAPTLDGSRLYWSSSIYRATSSIDPFAFIGDRVDAMKTALNSGRVQIKIKCCDVLELPIAFGASNMKQFDVVDFTNVADYVGLGNVLGIGSMLAKRMIYVQQMRWDRVTGDADMKRYLAECLGLGCGNDVLGLNVFKQLSGLSLEDHRLVKDVLNMTWKVDDTKLDEAVLSEDKFLKIAANYCRVLPPPSMMGQERACQRR